MSLSIRHWLAERHIDLDQLGHPGAQIAGIAFRIAQDMEVKSLSPFAISAITDVLELPLTAAWRAAEPISRLSVGLLRILSRKKPLRRNEGTWLTFQIAYLNALQKILEQESQLRRPWIERAEVPVGYEADQPLVDPPLLGLIKTLRPGRLSDSQAEQALSAVADSFLVQQMNNLAIAWFVANGAEETEAKLLTQRLSHGLPGHLLIVIAENALPLAQLQKFVRLGNLRSLRDPMTEEVDPYSEVPTATLPLNLDREYYRAGLSQRLSEPLFAAPFSLKDLYIPLKGRENPLPSNFKKEKVPPQPAPPIDLMAWAMSQLDDPTTIAVIEGEPGCGKTSFCQIWAAQVAQSLYPRWIPAIIRLRDATLGQTLEQTLENAFPVGRFTDTDGWLSPYSPPCLLILDGLDELPRSSQTERHLWAFVEQIMRFHDRDRETGGGPRHKIAIATRPSPLESLTQRYRQSSSLPLPMQLRRIAIEPMGQEEFRQWFMHWAKLQSKSIAQSYFNFLKHGGVFQQQSPVKELARLVTRPLMLYLVGILHRDALLDESIFQMESPQIKFEIYDRICRWLLGEPVAESGATPELIREGLAHASRSLEAIANLLQGRHPQDLRHQMQIAALTIIQTGQHQGPQPLIQQRLTEEFASLELPTTLPAFFFRTQPSLLRSDWGLGMQEREMNARRAFPGQPSPGKHPAPSPRQANRYLSCAPPPTLSGGTLRTRYCQPPTPGIEFTHLSLGEYLGAEEIATQLQAITQQVLDQYGEVTFAIPEAIGVARHLYGLLGYGLLSEEIEALVMEHLRRTQQRNTDTFSFPVLFQRLYRFYRAHCRGRWLDEGIAHQAHAQFQALQNPLNALQVEAAVGLNVFLLLCGAAREADILFWPCGNPEQPQEFDADRLLSFIGRTAALSPTAFWQRSRQGLQEVQLAQACLNRLMLAEANLWHANLAAAELIGTNLATANLQDANLSWASLAGANLADANLARAKLEGADLSGANLLGANLTSANLSHACLFRAQLDEQARDFARRSGAIFSLEEFQAYNQSLLPTQLVTRPDDDSLSDEEPTIFIESAEGEPMLPEPLNRNNRDERETETAQIEEPEQQRPKLSRESYDSEDFADEETIRLGELGKQE